MYLRIFLGTYVDIMSTSHKPAHIYNNLTIWFSDIRHILVLNIQLFPDLNYVEEKRFILTNFAFFVPAQTSLVVVAIIFPYSTFSISLRYYVIQPCGIDIDIVQILCCP